MTVSQLRTIFKINREAPRLPGGIKSETMIVCICKVVSDRTIKASIAAGAGTIDEVAMSCRAGTGCGACRPMIAALLIHAEACSGACSDCPGSNKSLSVPSPYLTTEKAA